MTSPGKGGTALLFLAPGDVRKARVEPISWMRTCEAFAKRGLDVTLSTLRVSRPDAVPKQAVWAHFGVPTRFRILELPTPLSHDSSVRRFRTWGGVGGLVLAIKTVIAQALRPRDSIVYARSAFLLAPFTVIRRILPAERRPRLVFETHTLPGGLAARVARAADLVVVTSRKLQADVVEQLHIPLEKVLHVPLGPYNVIREHPKVEARTWLDLPLGAPMACYSGKMLEDQTEFLLQSAGCLRRRLPGFRLVLVGGNPRIDEWTRRRTAELGLEDCVVAVGFVEPPRVSLYQSAADVLVFYMSESQLHYPYCTPAKGFEYQAAGRPIVAADIPLFDEVFGVDGERVVKVKERTPAGLAAGIERALNLPDGGDAMTARAKAWIAERTWEARVDAVLRALASPLPAQPRR